MVSVDRFSQLMGLAEDALDEKDALLALRVKEARKSCKKTGGIEFGV